MLLHIFKSLKHSVSPEKIGDYQLTVSGMTIDTNVAYIKNLNAIIVKCKRTSGWFSASGNGYQNASVSLPSKYIPNIPISVVALADFSAQFAMSIEIKTDGKLYLTVSYTNGMNSYGINEVSGILFL